MTQFDFLEAILLRVLLTIPPVSMLNPALHAIAIALPLLLLGLSLIALCYYSFAVYATQQFFAQPSPVDPAFHPPISILKPICGLDSGAYENLSSFCQQDYPDYQIIFGVQSPDDSSLVVVQQLIRDFPKLDIRYVISQRAIGANLKVTNLAYAATEASHDILLLADSDIRVGRDYLKRVVQPLKDSKVGVVTCMYRSQSRGWISAFEALATTTEFLPSVLVARKLEGVAFALGATIAIRKSVLDKIGGFAAIANYLEDDFLLGHLPAQAGYEVVISNYVVQHTIITESLPALISHQTRWARSNRFARPAGYAGLIFTYGTLSSLLFFLTTGASSLGWTVLLSVWSVRLLMAWVIAVKYLHDSVARRYLWLVPLRDLVSFVLWGYSFLGNTVEWRGRRFRLAKGGWLTELNPAGGSIPSVTLASLEEESAKKVGTGYL
jgi:ceramide glucosyltransferase